MKVLNPIKYHQILDKGYKNCNSPLFLLHYIGNNNQIYNIIVNYNNKIESIDRIKKAEKEPQFLKWHNYEK